MDVLGFASIVALIAGLVQVAKTAFGFPSRFAGAAAAGLGIVAGAAIAAWGGTGLSPLQDVLVGLTAGLTAAGGYSATKAATGR